MSASGPTIPATPGRQALPLALSGVIALAFVGFFVGVRQGRTATVSAQPPPRETVAVSEAVPSTKWAEFDRRHLGPNRDWRNTLANLQQPAIDLFAPVEWNEAMRRVTLAGRAERRAWDGAPPVVPHPIDQMSASACAACHTRGLTISNVRAPHMPHALMPNCTQCHVEQASSVTESFEFAPSTFEPIPAPLLGSRAWPGAPPTVPHSTFMREHCLACHGPAGPQAIRSTHPWRTNCLQCHAPSASLDQHEAGFGDAFGPPPVNSP